MTIPGCGMWADEVDWDAELPSPKKEWVELARRIKIQKRYCFYNKLADIYLEPNRHYHNLEHISGCISEFRESPYLAEHPNEIEFAIWFHDAVYDTRRKDNEERSAELATCWAEEMKLPDFFTNKVYQLILATKHNTVPIDRDSQVLVDVDLSILGKPEEIFDEYEKNTRKEYSWVPENVFRRERAKILEGFLSRDSIYCTEFFRDKYEEQAIKNLARSIKQLSD